ncbi:uncharacterized protein LOC132757206 [Ruditapes philippinarum]|uniref:uncharacterized protein LOC132757206 n=1 Tax=Ruditapes philippinarum TaxID=129788 RepID=UPI00295AD16D|nr:uncharacterized protein LOC132757206 [Ruditapes philippinarum]
MDTIWKFVRIILALLICNGFVDGLIGLRPADQAPHRDHTQKPPKPVSLKPSQFHHTQLYSPHDLPENIHNATIIETAAQPKRDGCQTVPLLRCSSQLLRHSLLNDTNVCRDIEQYTRCILAALEEYGRREYVTGLVMLDDLHSAAKHAFRCHGNESAIAHLRHRISKRNGGTCCTEGILNCSIQTFFKMSTNKRETCSLVNYYDVCMMEVSDTCHSRLFTSSYPTFVSQLKRHCKEGSERRKRSAIFKSVFSTLT